jgi:hypothetical protein
MYVYMNVYSWYEINISNKIVIGHDVWIGADVIIIDGVTIGHGAVVGAYTVVRKDIPPYAIVIGNPAIIAKYRFSEDEIKLLLQIEWWYWSDDEILHMPMSRNMQKFFLYAKKIRPNSGIDYSALDYSALVVTQM